MDIKFKADDEILNEKKIIGKLCEVCKLNEASYTCPKCNIFYCNLKCYKDQNKHFKCSEDFYQSQITEELKLCTIDDLSKHKMVDILKKLAKESETENILPDSDSKEDNNEEEYKKPIEEKDLINAYKNEIFNWKPWWHNAKDPLLVDLDDQEKTELKVFRFNQNLTKNSFEINVSNASDLILNEIVKLSYVYSLVANIYQLDELAQTNIECNQEIVTHILQIDKLIQKKIPNKVDINLQMNLLVKLLLAEQKILIKEYLNESFLVNLLDECVVLNESSKIMFKFISCIYDLVEILIKTEKNDKIKENKVESCESINNKPLNVFHLNKSSFSSQNQNEKDRANEDNSKIKRRVQILSNKNNKTEKPLENQIQNSIQHFKKENLSLKETKLFLKRLEFYFKWLFENKSNFDEKIKKISTNFKSLKESLINELKQLNEEKNLIQKNLNKLRKATNQTNEKIQEI